MIKRASPEAGRISYASSDTRLHVATSDLPTLLDYAFNTPPDALRSHDCVVQRRELINRNLACAKEAGLDVGQEASWRKSL